MRARCPPRAGLAGSPASTCPSRGSAPPRQRRSPWPQAGRVHRRRIRRRGRPPDPARRLRDPVGLLRPQETPREGPHRKPGRTRRYHIPPDAACTIAALLALRDHVIAPILAGIRSPASAAKPKTGPPSTAAARTSASACRHCSWTSASCPGPHPQGTIVPIRETHPGQPVVIVLRDLYRRTPVVSVAALAGGSHPGCSIARSASAGSVPRSSPAVRRCGFLWAEPWAVGLSCAH
jgi:hypothetical protein